MAWSPHMPEEVSLSPSFPPPNWPTRMRSHTPAHALWSPGMANSSWNTSVLLLERAAKVRTRSFVCPEVVASTGQ